MSEGARSARARTNWVAGVVAATFVVAGLLWGVGSVATAVDLTHASNVQPAILGQKVVITYACVGSVITEVRGPIIFVDCNNGTSTVSYNCGSSNTICAQVTITDTPLGNLTFSNWTSAHDAFFGPSATTSCGTHQFSSANPVGLCMNVPPASLVGTGTVIAHVL